jgi:hypothetical protein
MPLIMGSVHDQKRVKLPYPHVEVLAFQYLTDPEALVELLPECYQRGKDALVSIVFSENNGLSFMAGGGYRLAAVQVSAHFDGTQDHVEGDYILVMFENQTWPIIGGREDLGVPKLYADISPIKCMPDGHLRCEASYLGHAVTLTPPLKQTMIVESVCLQAINAKPWPAYKYINPDDRRCRLSTVTQMTRNLINCGWVRKPACASGPPGMRMLG